MTLQKDWAKPQVRIPPELHQQVKQYAKDNDSSMNSAILELIKVGLANQHNESVLASNQTNPTRIEKKSIIEYTDLPEPAISIDLPYAVIGLTEKNIRDIKIISMPKSNSWIFSYQGLKCSISPEAASYLIEKGCEFIQ